MHQVREYVVASKKTVLTYLISQIQFLSSALKSQRRKTLLILKLKTVSTMIKNFSFLDIPNSILEEKSRPNLVLGGADFSLDDIPSQLLCDDKKGLISDGTMPSIIQPLCNSRQVMFLTNLVRAKVFTQCSKSLKQK